MATEDAATPPLWSGEKFSIIWNRGWPEHHDGRNRATAAGIMLFRSKFAARKTHFMFFNFIVARLRMSVNSYFFHVICPHLLPVFFSRVYSMHHSLVGGRYTRVIVTLPSVQHLLSCDCCGATVGTAHAHWTMLSASSSASLAQRLHRRQNAELRLALVEG